MVVRLIPSLIVVCNDSCGVHSRPYRTLCCLHAGVHVQYEGRYVAGATVHIPGGLASILVVVCYLSQLALLTSMCVPVTTDQLATCRV